MPISIHNKISGKRDFFFTKDPYCGRRVLLRKKNQGKNRFGDIFYYCKKCRKGNRLIPKEIAFKWYCIGYRELEYQIEDENSRMNDDDLRTEFEMEWEYNKKVPEREVSGKK